MRTKIIILLVVVALAITASLVFAQGGARKGAPAAPPMVDRPGPGPGGPGCGPGFGPRILAQLKLSDAQMAQLKQLKQDFAAATEPARAQLLEGCKEMGQLWRADTPNATAIKTLAAQQDQLKSQIRDTGIDFALEALNVLTPEQREKLREIAGDRGCCGIGMCFGCGCCAMGPGCGAGCAMGPGKGAGAGMGPGAGCGMGAGAACGMGPRDGTGPRAGMGTCPMQPK